MLPRFVELEDCSFVPFFGILRHHQVATGFVFKNRSFNVHINTRYIDELQDELIHIPVYIYSATQQIEFILKVLRDLQTSPASSVSNPSDVKSFRIPTL